ncbi:MAG: hypothetical protein LBQ37_02045 [Elusimicrobiota bacterium]|jgi:hypothetical protein|nr:hypothetical protein [Elusimicrobiota bacterium]
MRKFLLTALALVFVVSNVFAASEINVKAGFDIFDALDGTMKTHSTLNYDDITVSDKDYIDSISGNGTGYSLFSEYLYQPVNSKYKFGFGLGYILTNDVSLKISDNEAKDSDKSGIRPTLQYIPIYITVQVNPFDLAKGVFFKGNIGYSFFHLNWNKNFEELFGDSNTRESLNGGFYGELAAGYEFSYGLILQLSYSFITSWAEYKFRTPGVDDITPWEANGKQTFNFSYHKIGISLGYKFKFL